MRTPCGGGRRRINLLQRRLHPFRAGRLGRYLRGQHPGHHRAVLLDNLPGYPDNLMRGLDGRIWLGYAKPRNPTVDKLADKPFLRKVTLRLPRALWPVPRPYGHGTPLPKTTGSWPTGRTPRAPIPKPRPSPRPRTGYTCRACMPDPSDGSRADRAGYSSNGICPAQ